MVIVPEDKYSFCRCGRLCSGSRLMSDWAGDHKDKLVMEVSVANASDARLPKLSQPTVVKGEFDVAKDARKDLAPLLVDVNSRVSC